MPVRNQIVWGRITCSTKALDLQDTFILKRWETMFGVVVKASLSTSISCSETNIMMRKIIRLQLINTASPFKKTPKIIMVSKIEPELIKNWEEIKKLWPIWTKSLDWILTILRPIISEVNNIVTREESKTL